MKVQNKFFMMSTSLILALVATSVHADVPGLRKLNRIQSELDRKERKLEKTDGQLEYMEQTGDGSQTKYDRKDRKYDKTAAQVVELRKQRDQMIESYNLYEYAEKEKNTYRPKTSARYTHNDPVAYNNGSDGVTITTTTVTFSGDGSVNVSNSGNPGQGGPGASNEPYALPANGSCAFGFYPVPEIKMCVPQSEAKDGPCDKKVNPNPVQDKTVNCSADPNSLPNADKTACVCKDGYEIDSTSKLCAKPVAKQSCEDQGKITDPDTKECLDVPPPPKPVVNKKPVRNKVVKKDKPVVKTPVKKSPVVKKDKPVKKEKPVVVTKQPCEDEINKKNQELANKQKEIDLKNQEISNQKVITQTTADSLKNVITAVQLQNEKDAPKFGVKINDKQEFKANYWKSNEVIGGSNDKISLSRKTKIKGQMTATTFDKVTTTLDRSRQNLSDSVIAIQKQYGIAPSQSAAAK